MATPGGARPGAGRPTKYRPEYCERVVEMGTRGLSFVEMAAELDVVRETLYNWADRYPEFSTALQRAREVSQAWWIQKGRDGLFTDKDVRFNDRQWKMMVSNLFPDDWRDSRDINVRGTVLHLGQDELARLPDPLLARIAQGEDPGTVLASVAGDVLGQLTAGEEAEEAEEADYEIVQEEMEGDRDPGPQPDEEEPAAPEDDGLEL